MEQQPGTKQGTATAPAAVAKDPVCGKEVEKGQAPAIAQYLGQAFYLCSPSCRRLFSKHPEKYLKRQEAAAI